MTLDALLSFPGWIALIFATFLVLSMLAALSAGIVALVGRLASDPYLRRRIASWL